MMFIFHTAITLGFIALSFGTLLIVWAARNEGKGISFANGVGIIVVIFAVLSMLCSTYYVFKYWHKGYFETLSGMSMTPNSSMMSSPGLNNMMPNKQMPSDAQ